MNIFTTLQYVFEIVFLFTSKNQAPHTPFSVLQLKGCGAL